MASALKRGTRIEMTTRFPGVPPQTARVVKRQPEHPHYGGGWYVVRFDDGSRLSVHETNFRVMRSAAFEAALDAVSAMGRTEP